jgi:hypothetical protein
MSKNIYYFGLAIFICAFSSSISAEETCLQNAWKSYESGDYANAIRYADQCIDNFGRKAMAIQEDCIQKGIPKPKLPITTDVERSKVFNRGLLNDVATACFVKGRSAESLYKMNKTKNKSYKTMAEEAYNMACEYNFGLCWDPKGWYWSPCDDANLRLPIK